MDLKLKDKMAVIFAASKGLGKGAALALANEGCKVAICSRDKNAIEQVAKEISEKYKTEVFSQAVDLEQKNQIAFNIFESKLFLR